MKAFLALTVIMTFAACGRIEHATKATYQNDLVGEWSTRCQDFGDSGSERHLLTMSKDDTFAFTTHRFSDKHCHTEALTVAYKGSYSIGGFVLHKGLSGRTVTMAFNTEEASPLTDREVGPFEAGSTHRVVLLVGGDHDELTEYERDGEVLRRYSKD